MRFPASPAFLFLSILGLAAAGAAEPAASANPLLAPSTLPYQLPPFEQIKDEHFAPAFEQSMAEELKEVEAITAPDAPAPTFENTLVALERS